MIPRIHQVEQHRTGVPGVEAVTLVSNHHFPRHTHDQFGIGVISSGAQRSWSAVGRVDASAGDVIMVNPGEMHDGIPFDGKPRRWRMIYLDPILVARETASEFVGSAEIVSPVARDPLLTRLFARLFACLTASPPDPLAREESLLRSLIYVMRQHGTARPPIHSASPCVERALERMNSAPNTPVSLAGLAALSGVSRFHLLRSFAREVGTTPHAYLIQRRVLLARALLANGQSLAEAALEAGFADQSHFTRAFVRQVGVTPRRYQAAIA
jgi:AraC-like DNA-binding protein